MKKIKLYIASSIDGYIARTDGSLDWLMKYPVNSETNYGYDSFYESVDMVIMGGRTYRDILNMDSVWPYRDKTTYIVTRNPMETEENIHFITEKIIEHITKLQEEKGKDIWLVRGSEIISMLLEYELIDEMIITTIPVLLGNGILLFSEISKESAWETVIFQKYANGVTQTHYRMCSMSINLPQNG